MLVTCVAPVSKVVHQVYVKATDSLRGTTLFSHFTRNRSYIKTHEGDDVVEMLQHAYQQHQQQQKKKHAPGGLSEIDSMKTFGLAVDGEVKGRESRAETLKGTWTAEDRPVGSQH